MKTSTFITATFALIFSISSNAALIDNGTYTTDTVSGLDWLDLTETNGLSYTYVNGQLGTGGLFVGYRYATNDEVVALWANFGINLSAGSTTSTAYVDHQIDPLVSLLGNTLGEYTTSYSGTIGYTSISQDIGYHDRMGVYYSASNTIYDVADHISQSDSYTYLHTGHYLVTPSAVPVPAAAWLFGSGLIGLIGVARRKARA